MNTLFVSIDDLFSISAWPEYKALVKTPNLDAFASESSVFNNAFSPVALCNPSRSSILSGQSPWVNGVLDNYSNLFDKVLPQNTLPGHLKAAGIEVAMGGKVFHRLPEDTSQLFDVNLSASGLRNGKSSEGTSVGFTNYGTPAEGQMLADSGLADNVIAYLANNPDPPFFLGAGIYRPHTDWIVPQEFFDLYDPIQIPVPDFNNTSEFAAFAETFADIPFHEEVLSADAWVDLIHAYFASVSYADHVFGQMIEALDTSPYSDSTNVVIWSDHGYHLGDKGAWHKFTLWEESGRAPLMIREAGQTTGQVIEDVVSLTDIFPTVFELAGQPVPPSSDGESLVPLLQGGSRPSGGSALTWLYGSFSLRTATHRYIRYEDGGEELFDILNDVHQTNNLVDDPIYTTTLNELRTAAMAELSLNSVILGDGEVLIGNSDNNLLIAGLTANRLEGGLGDDTYVYLLNQKNAEIVDTGGTDTVFSNGSYVMPMGIENFVTRSLAGVSDITGNAADNIINGGASADKLYGSNGNDTLNGNGNNDILEGGEGVDLLRGDSGEDTLVGGAGSDRLLGGHSKDELMGQVGHDHLIGGASSDTLNGGAGIDELSGQGAHDTFDGGEGLADRIKETADVNFTVSEGTLLGVGRDTFTNVEIVHLSAGESDNTINASRLTSTRAILLGRDGNDTLIGGASNDILIGEDGADRLTGGNGQDLFQVLSSSDSLLASYDQITDLQIGFDIIESFNPMMASDVMQFGSVSNLSESGIQAVLTTESFMVHDAATFVFGSQIFLSLNDDIAGFNAESDALIEITGYSGDLASLSINEKRLSILQSNTSTPLPIDSYSQLPGALTQDINSTIITSPIDLEITITGNGWKQFDTNTSITSSTVVSFEFLNPLEGEVHGFGFDENSSFDFGQQNNRSFRISGKQPFGFDISAYQTGTTLDGYDIYTVPVGQIGSFDSATDYDLVLINDHDVASPTATASFRNIIIDNTPIIDNAPINTVPISQIVGENMPLTIVGLSVDDADGNLATTELSVNNGTITIDLSGGASIVSGENATATMTLTGNQVQINAALTTVTYQGQANFNGLDTLTIISTDSTGVPLSDTDTLDITVNDNLSITQSNTSHIIPINSYAPFPEPNAQDNSSIITTSPNDLEITITGNGWKQFDTNTSITSSTVVSFEFQNPLEGEVHGFGFDENSSFDFGQQNTRSFRISGKQPFGSDVSAYQTGTTLDGYDIYTVPVGQIGSFDSATDYDLVLINDHDVASPVATSSFRHLEIQTFDDILHGTTGSDAYDFNTTSDGVDIIYDFEPNDTLQISASSFGGGLVKMTSLDTVASATGTFVSGDNPVSLGTAGNFLYDTNSGILNFDPDGIGIQDAVSIAQLAGTPSLDKSQIYIIA